MQPPAWACLLSPSLCHPVRPEALEVGDDVLFQSPVALPLNPLKNTVIENEGQLYREGQRSKERKEVGRIPSPEAMPYCGFLGQR